jgi:hypothetical protein
MRHLKILGFAIVAMTALSALGGPSSALGAKTKLCKENVAACPAAKTYPSGTMVSVETKDGTGTWGNITEAATLATNLGTIVCDSTAGLKTTQLEGEPLKADVTSLDFNGCEILLGGGVTEVCSVGGGSGNANNLPYKSSLTATGSGNGKLTAESGTGGNPGATIVCGAIINCTFSKATVTLPFTGGVPMSASFEASSITLERAGGKCPTSAKWLAQYFLTVPNENVFLTN